MPVACTSSPSDASTLLGLLATPHCRLQRHRFPALGCSSLPQVAEAWVRSSCFSSGKEGFSSVFKLAGLILLPGPTVQFPFCSTALDASNLQPLQVLCSSRSRAGEITSTSMAFSAVPAPEPWQWSRAAGFSCCSSSTAGARVLLGQCQSHRSGQCPQSTRGAWGWMNIGSGLVPASTGGVEARLLLSTAPGGPYKTFKMEQSPNQSCA